MNEKEKNEDLTWDDVKSFSKKAYELKSVIITLAAIWGFCSLFFYSTKHGVSMAQNFSSLPTLLLIITAGAVIIYLISLAVVLCPALFSADHYKAIYSNEAKDFGRFIILSGGLIFALQVLVFLLALEVSKWYISIPIIIGLSFIVWAAFYLKNIKNNNTKGKKSSEHISDAGLFLFNNCYMAIIGILISCLVAILIGGSLQSQIISYSITSIVYFFWCFTLSYPKKPILRRIKKQKLLLAFPVIPMFLLNLYLTDVALAIFRIGGGYEAVYHFKNDQAEGFPQELIDDTVKKNQQGKTQTLLVWMNIGDKKYVQAKNKQDKSKVFVIDQKNISYETLPNKFRFDSK